MTTHKETALQRLEGLKHQTELFSDPHFKCFTAVGAFVEAIDMAIAIYKESEGEAVKIERKRILEKYGSFNNGCSCCAGTDLEDEFKKEELTTDTV